MNHDTTTERAELDLLAHIDHAARRAALALPVQRTASGAPVAGCTHCTACRQPIPRERRAALPGVTLCTGCSAQRDACSPAPRWTRSTARHQFSSNAATV
jgi:RNA polymerase-binding transcription factor DksA